MWFTIICGAATHYAQAWVTGHVGCHCGVTECGLYSNLWSNGMWCTGLSYEACWKSLESYRVWFDSNLFLMNRVQRMNQSTNPSIQGLQVRCLPDLTSPFMHRMLVDLRTKHHLGIRSLQTGERKQKLMLWLTSWFSQWMDLQILIYMVCWHVGSLCTDVEDCKCAVDDFRLWCQFVLKTERIRISASLGMQPASSRFHHLQTGLI